MTLLTPACRQAGLTPLFIRGEGNWIKLVVVLKTQLSPLSSSEERGLGQAEILKKKIGG
jgi:hypothetical protein